MKTATMIVLWIYALIRRWGNAFQGIITRLVTRKATRGDTYERCQTLKEAAKATSRVGRCKRVPEHMAEQADLYSSVAS